MEQHNLCGRDHEVRESIVRQDHLAGSEDIRREFQGNLDGSQPTEAHDDSEARNDFWSNDFWSIDGDFIYRHHVEPRVQPYVPKEETFPIPLKHINVTRTTHTNLDVLQEKRINDNWNVD